MKKLIAAVILCAFACEGVHATQYSKLSIITSAKRLGCWASIKAFISNADLKDEWDACQYLSDDNQQFAAATNALVTAGLCSAEDIAGVLSNSVDTAVFDTYLRRVYDNDMNTSTGRIRWHGKVVRTVVNTNALTKVTFYEDGTAITDEAKIVSKKVETPKTTMTTNGVPVRLAKARARMTADKSAISNVTVTVTSCSN